MNSQESAPFVPDSERAFEQYKPLIRSVIGRYDYGHYGIQVEDLIQDVRFRLWRAFHREIDGRKVGSYIKKVVNSVIINHLTEARRELDVLRLTTETTSGSTTSEFENIVAECVESLSESRRVVVKMFLKGLSVPDIAQALKWTKSKTYNLRDRGIRDLRKRLSSRGVEYEIK
jgi:RNA polymerase sigma factor (sigma-70 family)